MNRPPLAARLLLVLLVPRRLYEAIAGDLEERWHESGGQNADFWAGAIRSIADCWRDRLTRQAIPRESRGGIMRALVYDVRYGVRMMVKNPGFTIAAVITLGIGIGATTAIFSMVNAFSLKPLSFRDPSRVTFVFGKDLDSGERMFSIPLADYLDIQRQASSLEAVSAYSYLSANLTGGDIPERVQAYRVTGNTFELLGVAAALGRTFSERDASTQNPVVVLSDGLWRRRFGADPAAVGRAIVLNGSSYQIVGVMPRRFEYPVFNFKGDLWVPWTIAQSQVPDRSSLGNGTVIARIRSEVPISQAEAELQTIMRRLAAAHPTTNSRLSVSLVEMGRLDDEQAGPASIIVSASVLAVLLLACANVANLLLARGVSRGRELAVRAALGASRWRLARQLLIESLLLAAVGGAVGVALAMASLDWLKRSLPELVLTTVPNVNDIGVDAQTLAFALIATIGATVAVGLLPALRASRPRPQVALKERSSAGGSRAARRLRTTVVIAEIAFATLLVITATLLVRGYASLQRVDPGFSPEGVLTMAVTLPADRYGTAERRRQFYEQSLERIERLPSVESAAFVNVLPFSTYDRRARFVIDGQPLPPTGQEPFAALRVATPGYLSTMKVPFHEGRQFGRVDTSISPLVAIANEAFSRRYLNGASALNHRVRFAGSDEAPWITIVGTIGDVHHEGLTQPPSPELYVPLSQAAGTTMMMLAVRVNGAPPEALVAPVRAAIMDVDPLQPVYHVKPMTRLMADSLLPRSMAAAVVGTFSVVALILSVVGVYGVVSYAVTQQMTEFGIRLAIGATPRELMAMVMRRSALIMLAGVVIGAAAAMAAAGVLQSLLYGVSGLDPATYATSVLVLMTIGLGACLLPAWRASSAEPVAALRAE
jgi:putative ABC transport system permease protein